MSEARNVAASNEQISRRTFSCANEIRSRAQTHTREVAKRKKDPPTNSTSVELRCIVYFVNTTNSPASIPNRALRNIFNDHCEFLCDGDGDAALSFFKSASQRRARDGVVHGACTRSRSSNWNRKNATVFSVDTCVQLTISPSLCRRLA